MAREALQKNLALNKLTNVALLNTALGEHVGLVGLRIPECGDPTGTNQGLSSVLALETPAETITVPMTTLDHVMHSHDVRQVRLVKIDVQGYDAKVIRGMQVMLEDAHPIVVFEYERWAWELSGESLGGLAEWLHERGYRMCSIRGECPTRMQPLPAMVSDHADIVAVHSSYGCS
jgi:FkbM family methyltransferase